MFNDSRVFTISRIYETKYRSLIINGIELILKIIVIKENKIVIKQDRFAELWNFKRERERERTRDLNCQLEQFSILE